MPTHIQSRDDPELIAHERTYHTFNVIVRWFMVHLASLLAGLTLWFATPAGFWAGLIAAALVFAVGYGLVVRREEHRPLDPWGGPD